MDVSEVLKYSDRKYRRVTPVNTSKITNSQRRGVEARIPDLIEYVKEVRKGLDACQIHPAYPIGFCGEITDEVFKRLKDTKAIQAMQKDGIVFKKIWGIYEDAFQNAIQLGHLFVNVAGDTVTNEKNHTLVVPLAESGFKTINSYDDFFNVAKSYWEFDVVPNYVFPLMSGVLPYIFTSGEEAYFSHQHESPLLSQDIRGNFSEAERIMFSKLKGKTLTQQQYDFLMNRIKLDFDEVLKRHSKDGLERYFQPHKQEEHQDMFRQMKEMWGIPSVAGKIYCLHLVAFKDRIDEHFQEKEEN